MFQWQIAIGNYYHPLGSIMRKPRYLKGHVILEIVILKLCIIPPDNVLKGAIQDISNAYNHFNRVKIESSSDSNEMHIDSR